MHQYASFAVSSLREAAIFNAGAALVGAAVLLLFQVPLQSSYGFILLLESTGLMLVGGALGVAGQATTRKITEIVTRRKMDELQIGKSDSKAALYALTGAFLFVEGAVLAALLA